MCIYPQAIQNAIILDLSLFQKRQTGRWYSLSVRVTGLKPRSHKYFLKREGRHVIIIFARAHLKKRMKDQVQKIH